MILQKYKDRGDTKKLCTPCSQREASQRTLQKSTVISEIEQKHNIRLLEPFNGTKNKHNFQCSCGKTFIDLPYNIAKKEKMNSCFCSSKRIVVKHDLSRMGDQLLAYGVTNFTWGNRGRQQKVNLSCEECNAIFSRNYNKLLNHDPKLCQRCLNKSISQTRSGANLLSDVQSEVQRLGLHNPKIELRQISYDCLSCSAPLSYSLAYLKRSKKDVRFCRACSMNIAWGNLVSNPSESLKQTLGKDYVFTTDEITKTCTQCSTEFTTSVGEELQSPREVCVPCRGSSGEVEIYEWLRNIYDGEIIRRDRTLLKNDRNFPLEIDLYLPEFRLGIEYHGLWWHSERFCGRSARKKHYQKLEEAIKKGITLIQIYENEWNHKKDKIQDIILHKIGKCKKIYARKTEIVSVSLSDARDFLKDNHIQGWSPAKLYIGLTHNRQLVYVCSFGTSRFDKSVEWEILRSAAQSGIQVVGGFSKILKHFQKSVQPSSIISYCDRRFFDGHSYLANGFQLVDISAPSYYYFKNPRELHNRLSFQKKKLQSLSTYSQDKSEWQIMSESGWNRIWDCGNLVFKLF